MGSLLERRGNWDYLTEGRVHALYEAWWGKEITERTIPISDDFDNDVNDVSPQAPKSHIIIDIDQGIEHKPIGEILLRQEFVTLREYTESLASQRPESGLVITGQPGIGEYCVMAEHFYRPNYEKL